MDKFNKCDNGHYYKKTLDSCPYCPGGGTSSPKPSSPPQSAQVPPTEFNDLDTVKTVQYGGQAKTTLAQEKTKDISKQEMTGLDFDSMEGNQTIIYRKKGTGSDPEGGYDNSKTGPVNLPARKLVGWLVSYTLDEFGMDFRLFEGRNTIGQSPANNVSVMQDQTVSGNHAVILYREDNYYLKDLLSSNGTKLNGVSLEPDVAAKLKDNDIIEVGKTVFRFKVSL